MVVHHGKYDAKLFHGVDYPKLQEVGGDNDFLYCREVPEVILLATCWIIATTVILNGSTMKFVMGLVGLTEKSQASRALHSHLPSHLHAHLHHASLHTSLRYLQDRSTRSTPRSGFFLFIGDAQRPYIERRLPHRQ